MNLLSSLFDSQTTTFDKGGNQQTQTTPGFFSNLLSGIGNLIRPPQQKTQAAPIQHGPGFDQPMLQPSGDPQPRLSQTPASTQGFRLSVPSDNGNYSLPPEIAQQIGNVFEPTKTATAAAQVLIHPNQQTRTKAELARGLGENWNRGENPQMITKNIDIPNPDGSIDRGLYRINSNTFNGMMQNPFWKNAMENRGIHSWADMEDPNKNIQMAYLILARSNWDSENNQMLSNPNWAAWYAAPLEQRQ